MTEQEFLRQSGVPDAGTPERAAWELVVAWAQNDREGDRPLRLGRVIHDHYPKLIARIAAREAEVARYRRALEATLTHLKRHHRDPVCPVVRDAEEVLAGHDPYWDPDEDVTDAAGAGPGRASTKEG